MDRDITLFPENAKIGIAIFANNDEDTIPSVIILSKNYSKNVMVIDDGSTDGTASLSKTLGVEVISFDETRGRGTGLKTAFNWARKKDFDVLITIDGDGRYDPGIIPFLAEPVIKKKADLSIGSKGFTYTGKTRKGFSWRLGNWMTKRARMSRISSPIYDKKSGYRAYHKRTFNKFNFQTEGYDLERSILEQADERRLNITEVPMKAIYGRLEKEDLGWGNWALTRISRTMKGLRIDSPLRLSLLVSTCLILLATGTAIFTKIQYPNHDLLAPGGILIVMSLVGLAGLVLLNGIILETISHVGTNIVSYLQKNDQIKLEYDPLKGFQR